MDTLKLETPLKNPTSSIKDCWEIPHQCGTCLKPTFSDFNEIWSICTYCEDK